MITEYALPTSNSGATGIASGPDGNLWFTEAGGNRIGRITASGEITEYPVPTWGSAPDAITSGPDGNLWFTERRVDSIARIGPAGTATIVDDDPSPSLSISDVTAVERDSWVKTYAFTVSLSAPSGKIVSVKYATANASADAGSDYTASSGTIAFSPGRVAVTIEVTVSGDTAIEPDEQFRNALSDATNATISDAEGIGTILNDDTSISVDDVSVTEGDSGGSHAVFTVRLAAPSAKMVAVGYATADVSATAGADYIATSGTLWFSAGETTKSIYVTVYGDRAVEADETFSVNLSNPTDATIADGQGMGTITNDDAGLSIDDVTRDEGSAGTTSFTFTVTRSGATNTTVSVAYATQDGTADASDYDATSGTLTFGAGETTKTITVTVYGDTDFEDDESFSVKLADPSKATITDATGTGMIVNDDEPMCGPNPC